MSLSVAACLVLLLQAPLEGNKGSYEVPAKFEAGVRKLLPKTVVEVKVDATLKKQYEALASAGKIDEILKEDSKWMPYIINGLLGDDEKIAHSTYKALHGVCKKHQISSKEDRFENPIKLEHFNSAYVRSGEYDFWSDWWSRPQNQAAVRQWARGAEAMGEVPEMVKWEELVRDLRGGGYDDPDHPGGRAYLRIKLMGKAAWPYLIKHIDHEDIMIGKAVVTALNELTRQQRPLPTEATKAQFKREWESWMEREGVEIGSWASLEVARMMVSQKTEAEVRLLLDDLTSEHYKTRSKAQEELMECALRHAGLIRQAYNQTSDAEVRYRLDPIVQGLPRWQAEESRIRSKPDLLQEALKRLPEGMPEELRKRIETLHRDLKK